MTGAAATAGGTSGAGAAYRTVAPQDVPANRRRGGELRVLLSPVTVGSTAGFMGVATLQPGERINEHYHPYSEEFLYLVRGELTVDLDGTAVPLAAGRGLHIPIGTRHRLRNTGSAEAFALFQLAPLAPRPELGHVDTEDAGPAGAAAAVPGPGERVHE
jgi:quercetin dioxygenase-like cupin family protein